MLTLRNTIGKCVYTTKYVPSVTINNSFHQSGAVSDGVKDGPWQFLKRKLGIGKNRSKEEAVDPYAEQTFEVQEERNPSDELYKPGYRGRTENKRF